jgi:23S rRNA (uracil1939-C5)-methyltransferase
MSKIKKNFELQGLEVVDTSTEGKAIARHENLVVFIDGAVPGDVVDVMVHRKKNSYAEAKVTRIVTPSPNRVEPRCEHFGTCGGCKWQSLNYQTQLYFKQKYVTDAFTRIGKLTFPEPAPILGNKDNYFYRNKLEFSFSNKKWLTNEEIKNNVDVPNKNGLGFHIPGLFDKILDINNCYLQAEPSNSIRLAIREYAFKHNFTFFDIRNKAGFLRTAMIRTTSTKEVMVVLSMFENNEADMKALCAHLKERFPQITSLQYVHNPKGNDTIQDLDLITYSGKDHVTEEMEGLKFNISAKSFYQTNSEQAYELYKIAREYAQLKESDVVYDLYTGTGTIANFVARSCKKVVGIEYVEAAVKDAFKNSEINGIKNTHFTAGNMKDVFTFEFVNTHGNPDVIITDPPRAGMDPEVVNIMLHLKPKRIVYVSCNPSTQARDLALMEGLYRIDRVQAVDMFPQTAHVENVALLTLK